MMVQMSALKWINVTGCENNVKVLLYSHMKFFSLYLYVLEKETSVTFSRKTKTTKNAPPVCSVLLSNCDKISATQRSAIDV